MTVCLHCNGRGYHQCDNCLGVGSYDGPIYEKTIFGVIPTHHGEVKCPYCKGIGTFKCNSCNGTGEILTDLIFKKE
jgi:hypothetical protein